MVRCTATWILAAVSISLVGCIGGRTGMEVPQTDASGASAKMDGGTGGRLLDGGAKLDSSPAVDTGRAPDANPISPDARLPVDTRPAIDSRAPADVFVPDTRLPIDVRIPLDLPSPIDVRGPVDTRLPVDTRVPVDGGPGRVDAPVVCVDGNTCTLACTVACNGIGTRTCDCVRGRLSCGACEVPPIVVGQAPCPDGANGSACSRPGLVCISATGQGTGCVCVSRPRTATTTWFCL